MGYKDTKTLSGQMRVTDQLISFLRGELFQTLVNNKATGRKVHGEESVFL